jgi:hypothetical protein
MLARESGARLMVNDIGFADAEMARARQAATHGALCDMVGACDQVFANIRQISPCQISP